MKTFKYIETETFEQNFKRWKKVLGSEIMHQREDLVYLYFRREWIDFKKPATPNIPYISFNRAPALSIDSNRIDCPDGDFQVLEFDENNNGVYSDTRVVVRNGVFDLTSALKAHKELIDRGIIPERYGYFEGLSFIGNKGALEIHCGS